MFEAVMASPRGYKYKDVGERIEAARRACGYSRVELAERLGVDSQTIWNWESGYYRPRHDRLVELARALRTTSGQLLGERVTRVADSVTKYMVDEPPPTPEELRMAAEFIRLLRRQKPVRDDPEDEER